MLQFIIGCELFNSHNVQITPATSQASRTINETKGKEEKQNTFRLIYVPSGGKVNLKDVINE